MTLPPGTRVGRHVLVRKLGEGGMGVVYEAKDEQLGRNVALKIASRALVADETTRKRFVREAQAAATLRSPHVVSVHEVGEHEGLPYLVMELLPGGTLRSRMKVAGALPWPEVAGYGTEIASGLAAIHAAGLVHRDLKPENVLLDEQGRCKLADLGLVGVGEGSGLSVTSALTRTGELLGTLEFMAPEQADAKAAGPPADVYSLGATLFALLAGRPPFEGRGVVLMKKVLMDRPPSLAKLAPEAPKVLVALVERMLAKDSASRPTVEAVLAALGGIEEAGERSGPPQPPRYAAAALGGAAVLVVGILWTLHAKTKEPEPGTPDRDATPRTQFDVAPSASRTAARPSFKLSLAWSSDPPGRDATATDFRGHTKAVVSLAVSRDHVATASRDNSIGWWPLDGRTVRKVHGYHKSTISSVAIDRDGFKLASADDGGHIWLSNTNDLDSWIVVQPGLEPILCLGFGKNGATVLGGSADGKVYPWDEVTDHQEPAIVRPPPDEKVAAIAVSSDGRELLLARKVVEVWSLPAAEKRLRVLGAPRSQAARAVAWISSGTRLRTLAGGVGGWLEVSEADGSGSTSLEPHGATVTSVAVSRDARLGASSSEDGKVRLWDLATLTRVDEVDLAPDHANAVGLTEGGDLLLVGTQRGLLLAYRTGAR